MKTFSYIRAQGVDAALESITAERGAKFLGGGTNLVDLMREGIETPETLIDITRLPLDGIDEIAGGGLRIGALVRNSALILTPAPGE
jgi:xanthine dehydrogenase YagS FAD-binding subunit